MSVHEINSVSDLKDLIFNRSASGISRAKLMQDITISQSDNSDFPLALQTGSDLTFEGMRNKIIIDSDVVDFDGIFGGVTNQTLTINKLEVEVTGGATIRNGIIRSAANFHNSNLYINDCCATGTYTLNVTGAIAGGVTTSDGNGSINITGCYSTGTLAGDSGGILSSVIDAGLTITITDCYSTGNITGTYAAGIWGDSTSGAVGTIENCYSTGNITNGSAAGIVGYAKSGLTVSNCYSAGSISNGGKGIMGWGSSGSSIQNCYSLYAGSTGSGNGNFYGGTTSVSNSAVASSAGTWDATLGTSLLDDGTWDDTDSSNPFLLSHFQADPWDNSTYTSAGDSDIGYAAGDPHITPLIGKRYDLNVLGEFLLFDNNHENRLIIKGVSECGDGKHYRLTYIRKLSIELGEKSLLIDTGFRGKKVTILDNKGFTNIKMRDLKMGRNIKRICDEKTCRHKTTDDNYKAHDHNDHIIQPLLRNELSIIINVPGDNTYHIIVRNVNFMNVHPCQVRISPKDISKLDNYSGAIVRDEKITFTDKNNMYKF